MKSTMRFALALLHHHQSSVAGAIPWGIATPNSQQEYSNSDEKLNCGKSARRRNKAE